MCQNKHVFERCFNCTGIRKFTYLRSQLMCCCQEDAFYGLKMDANASKPSACVIDDYPPNVKRNEPGTSRHSTCVSEGRKEFAFRFGKRKLNFSQKSFALVTLSLFIKFLHRTIVANLIKSTTTLVSFI